ncbi:MAG TPA: potassium channel protein [Acidimicrobiales bacterium]|nr:potassium channel protein [Acidimicrobiales bacterium]
MRPVRRLRPAAFAFIAVVTIGTAGYTALGFAPLDALYQTVTTVTTVGFREVHPLSDVGQVFTIALILAGVGTALYTFGAVFETLAEGHLRTARKRKLMDRRIAALSGHVIVCGWGRVGRAIAREVAADGRPVVVVDQDENRLRGIPHFHVVGDATSDDILLEAGLQRAHALIAAIDTDAENLYVTLSGRSLRPDLFIIARARDEASEEKLVRAGADRVVNPQAIGGARMAAFVSQPNVSEFLDVVMHDGSFEFRLAEVVIEPGSPLAGKSLLDAAIRERTGALVLALRKPDGGFVTRPTADAVIEPGHVLIVIGTSTELQDLAAANAS